MPARVAFLLLALLLVSGCAETYCQSGPLYGTQCYSTNEIDLQRSISRGESPPTDRGYPRFTGCASASEPQGFHLESADCVTHRHMMQGR